MKILLWERQCPDPAWVHQELAVTPKAIVGGWEGEVSHFTHFMHKIFKQKMHFHTEL